MPGAGAMRRVHANDISPAGFALSDFGKRGFSPGFFDRRVQRLQ